MTDEPRALKPCEVTLFWRRYGDDIEWRADFVPFPIPTAKSHDINGWQSVSRRDGDPDPLYTAAFLAGLRVHSYGGHATQLRIVEEPAVREPPRMASLTESGGELDEDGLTIEFGGACPIQGIGSLDDRVVYYRARGKGWSFEVWPVGATCELGELPDGDPEWSYSKPDAYAWPDGGWLHHETSIANLREALAAWRMKENGDG